MNRFLLALVSFVACGSASAAEDVTAFRDLTDAAGRAAAVKTLNGYLQRLGGHVKIHDCGTLLASHPGQVEDIYGGACELQTGSKVVLCGDTGIGEFSLSQNIAPTREAVSRFMRENCPGG